MTPIVIARLRRLAALALGLCVALSTVTPLALVEAQAPPTNAGFEATLEGLCAFPVHFLMTGKRDVSHLPGGGLRVTYQALSATLTNTVSGESVTLSGTGTVQTTTLENGFVQYVYAGTLVQHVEGTGEIFDLCTP